MEKYADECMRLAFQAIQRGDYPERDRLCERARALIAAEHQAAAMEKVMAVDFYVTASGTAIPTMLMVKASGAIQ